MNRKNDKLYKIWNVGCSQHNNNTLKFTYFIQVLLKTVIQKYYYYEIFK